VSILCVHTDSFKRSSQDLNSRTSRLAKMQVMRTKIHGQKKDTSLKAQDTKGQERFINDVAELRRSQRGKRFNSCAVGDGTARRRQFRDEVSVDGAVKGAV
jgi:hypothetical protein